MLINIHHKQHRKIFEFSIISKTVKNSFCLFVFAFFNLSPSLVRLVLNSLQYPLFKLVFLLINYELYL